MNVPNKAANCGESGWHHGENRPLRQATQGAVFFVPRLLVIDRHLVSRKGSYAMSQFQASNTLTFGNANAPHQVWAVLNLGCSDTRDWFNAHFDALEKAVAAGRVQLHIQFWSKQKVPLVSGNVANAYIDYHDPQAALAYTKAVFADQDALKAAPDVRAYLEQTYGVTRNPQAELVDAQVAEAIAAAGITSVPTIVYDGQLYFDETLAKLPEF